MQLIKATVGLTNYYVNQVSRSSTMDIGTTTIDALVNDNLMGAISQNTIMQAAAMSGCLNAQAEGFANINGGWNESKGLMKLDFIVVDRVVHVEYLHVIGYLVNNNSQAGITDDAVFVPQYSWKSNESNVGSNDMGVPTAIRKNISNRNDYLLSDGVSNLGAFSLRPADIFEGAMNKGTRSEVEKRMQEELMAMGNDQPFVPVTHTASSDIARVGVVASNRSNMNPSQYAQALLTGSLDYNTRLKNYAGGGYGDAETQGLNDGALGELANCTHACSNREPQVLRDEFFADMMQGTGNAYLRGFKGYTMFDILNMYENFEEVLDMTFFDASLYPAVDFTETTQTMGTSNLAEIVSHQIMFNISDLLSRHGLMAISMEGSNCDGQVGDGQLGNVGIFPFNPTSMEDNDMLMGQKADQLTTDLTNQIFMRLNGESGRYMTPIRFRVDAELMGSTTISMTVVDDSNINAQFGAAGSRYEKVWSFPTFALNSASCVVGGSETSLNAGSNLYDNIMSYFS